MDLNVQLVKSLRESVGDDVALMFDAYQGWDLQYAIEWCRKVEQFRPTFVEEAVPMSDLESFIRLSQSTTVPSPPANICTAAGKPSSSSRRMRCSTSRPTPSGAAASAKP